jgi:hypothetical protein
MYVLCAGLLLLLLLAACGGPGHETPDGAAELMTLPAGESNPANQGALPAVAMVSSSLPDLARLDVLADAKNTLESRQASAICSSGGIIPSGRLAESDNIVHSPDGKATLASTPGNLEWMIFEAFNAGSECSSVAITGVVLKPGYYFAIPDFATGRWNLSEQDPPGGPAFVLPLDEARYYSPKHRQYFAILAADGGQFQLEYAVTQIKCLEPLVSIIVNDISSGVELVDCSGLPGISYVDKNSSLVFALAKDTEPAGPLDWRVSVIDTENYGIIQDLAIHKGKPVILYASLLDDSLWIAAANTTQPLSGSDWQHQQLFVDANCVYCSIASTGERLSLAWFENDPTDSDTDNRYAYLHYAVSDTADPQASYSDYRLIAMGNEIYADFAQPALASIDGLPAIAIVNFKPGENSHVLYFQSSSSKPLLSDWTNQEFADTAELPFVDLSEMNGRPLIVWRNALLRAYGGKQAQPLLPTDWNYSDLSGATPHESFDWISINDRPYYCFVSTLSGPYEIFYAGGAPARFFPQDNLIEEIRTLTANSVPTLGNPMLSMAAVAGKPAIVYFDAGDGSLNYVQLVIE